MALCALCVNAEIRFTAHHLTLRIWASAVSRRTPCIRCSGETLFLKEVRIVGSFPFEKCRRGVCGVCILWYGLGEICKMRWRDCERGHLVLVRRAYGSSIGNGLREDP